MEALEDRIVPAADYWTGATSSDWGTGTNWSLNRAPTNTDDAYFDSTQFNNQTGGNLPCSLSANVNPQSVTFAGNLPASTILTIASGGVLQTPELTIEARTAGQGAQAEIQTTGQLIVATDTNHNSAIMNWYGGDIAGSGTLTVSAELTKQAALTVTGASSSDMPTLGVPLQLNTGDGGGSTTMSFGDALGQPLVVKGNASITVYPYAELQFDGRGVAGDDAVTAITSGDSSAHVISVSGGLVTSDGTFKQVVQMGVQLASGYDSYLDTVQAQNNGGNEPLEFTGTTGGTGTCGMLVYGGTVNVSGKMQVDYGLEMDGGGTVNVNSSAVLTLGLNSSSTTSEIYQDGVLNLSGTLIAHGGFNMSAGTFNVQSSP